VTAQQIHERNRRVLAEIMRENKLTAEEGYREERSKSPAWPHRQAPKEYVLVRRKRS